MELNDGSDSNFTYDDYTDQNTNWIFVGLDKNWVNGDQPFCTTYNKSFITNPFLNYKDRLYDPHWKWSIIAVYSTIILTSILSNFLIIGTYFTSKHTRTICSLLLVALCFADLAQVLITTPLQLYVVSYPWRQGELSCKIVLTLFGLPLYTSILLVALIAFDRYRKICCSDSWQLSKGMTLKLIAGAFFFSTLVAMPVFVQATTIEDYGLCMEQNTYYVRFMYTFAVFLVQFCLPVILITIIYARIFTFINSNEHRKQRMNMNRLHTILVMHTITFVALRLPNELYSLVYETNLFLMKYYNESSAPRMLKTLECEMRVLDLCLKAIALLSTIVHPIMYGIMNKKIRAEMRSNWKNAADKLTMMIPRMTRGSNSTLDGRTGATSAIQNSVYHHTNHHNNRHNKHSQASDVRGWESPLLNTTANRAARLTLTANPGVTNGLDKNGASNIPSTTIKARDDQLTIPKETKYALNASVTRPLLTQSPSPHRREKKFLAVADVATVPANCQTRNTNCSNTSDATNGTAVSSQNEAQIAEHQKDKSAKDNQKVVIYQNGSILIDNFEPANDYIKDTIYMV